MRVQSTANNQTFYLFGDHLGSTSLVVDSSGNPVSEQRYKAWGELRYEWGTTVSDYTYTGQRAEIGLGLMFYNARWYDPALGRFAQADSIVPQPGSPLAWDRYAYTKNRPINFIDPNGHRDCSDVDSNGQCIIVPNLEFAFMLSAAELGIVFSGEWSEEQKTYVLRGATITANRFAIALGVNPGLAFRRIYSIKLGSSRREDYFLFEMGACEKCEGGHAYTHSARRVEYNKANPFYIKTKNRTWNLVIELDIHNVIHELGHAFGSRFKPEAPNNPNLEVGRESSLLDDDGYALPPDYAQVCGR